MLVTGNPQLNKFRSIPFPPASRQRLHFLLYPIYGPSMLPTLNFTDDVLLVEKLSPLLGKVAPGDVVLVRSPENPRKVIMKRVLGMEGDRVTFLVDPAHSQCSQSLVVRFCSATLNNYFWCRRVMCGSREIASNDSRNFGPIPYGLILGKIFCRVWPPQGFGPLGQ